MLRIRTFSAIRPHANKAAHVACVPYDVVSTAEARELARGLPYSFLHVVRSEIDLPEGIDPYDQRVYAKARENLQRFLREGALIRESSPQMYLYRQVRDHRSQIGLCCCCHVDDYERGLIKQHEKTRKDKEDDRTRHIVAVKAHAEPVLLAYRDQPHVDDLVEADVNDRPLFHFVARDGVTHTVWVVHEPQRYIDAFAGSGGGPGVACAYIADGHHRSASAARAAAELGSGGKSRDDESGWFLGVLFPASQLRILPYNRLVKDLNSLSPVEVLKRMSAVGKVVSTANPQPQRAGVVCIYLNGAWHSLQFDQRWGPHWSSSANGGPSSAPPHADLIGSLDVSLLQDRVLGPILGVGDPRTDKRIDFVGGIRGTAELSARVDAGQAAIAFSMHPTTIEQLMAVADAGQIMPPKSTWFEPKLRSGLLVHTLES